MSLILLAISFIMSGLSAVMNKELIAVGLGSYKESYMLGLFLVGAIFGTFNMLKGRERISREDAQVGTMMGVGNVVASLLFLMVLTGTQGIWAFPMRSLGNLILTAIVSTIAWKERLSKSQLLAVALSLIAIWLIY